MCSEVIVIIKQSGSSEGVRGERHLLNLDEKERTAHSFCGKFWIGWGENKDGDINNHCDGGGKGVESLYSCTHLHSGSEIY